MNAISQGVAVGERGATVPWPLSAGGSWRYFENVCFAVTSSTRYFYSSSPYMVLQFNAKLRLLTGHLTVSSV